MRRVFRILLILGVLGVLLIIVSSVLVCGVGAKKPAQRNACINNLRQIDGAKEDVALTQKLKPGDVVLVDDVIVLLKGKQWPVCPAGGTYAVGLVDQPPRCTVAGHSLN